MELIAFTLGLILAAIGCIAWLLSDWLLTHAEKISFEERSSDGIPYHFYSYHRSGSWILSVPAVKRPRVLFRVETRFDRIAKHFGVAREMQSLDKDFDSKVYIETNGEASQIVLRKDDDLRSAVRNLLELGFDRVTSHGARVSAYWNGRRAKIEITADDDTVIRLLQVVATRLPEVSDVERRLEVERARPQITIAVAGVLTALLGLFICMAPHSLGPLLEEYRIWRWALPRSLALTASLLSIAYIVLGANSRRHRTILVTFACTAFGLLGIIVYLAGEGNETADYSPDQFINGIVSDQKIVPGSRHHSPKYLLRIPELRTISGKDAISVSRSAFRSFPRNTPVRLTIQGGALGVPWISSMEATSGSRTIPFSAGNISTAHWRSYLMPW